jgi:hypothetical protein
MTQDKLLEQAIELLALADFSNLKLAAERNQVVKAGVELLLQPRRTEQGPVAWYDPSNGVVSTDKDCSLFTPLGQVWPLYPKGEWVGLTDGEYQNILKQTEGCGHLAFYNLVESKLREKNYGSAAG